MAQIQNHRFFLFFFVFFIILGLTVSPLFLKAENLSVTVYVKSKTPPLPPGGGGGGGGPPPAITQAIFRGKAYPSSKVTLLKDGQIAARLPTSPDASFEISLSGLSAGTYNFGVWLEDQEGNKSLTQNFVVTITAGVTTIISGIFLPPTISVDKIEVKRGEILNILGQTLPQAAVTIVINSEEEIIKKTEADKNGIWLYKFDTTEVNYGSHLAKSRADYQNDYSNYSNSVSFKVSNKTIYIPKIKKCPSKGDLNNDCRVNLVDFSITAYWYKRTLTSYARTEIDSKLKPDGKIDLVDFSILAYYWTG